MKRVAIVIGHGPQIDPGAVNPNSKMSELVYNRDLAQRIRSQIMIVGRQEVLPLIINRTTERLQPVTETNASGADLAIELHCNDSENNTASGTEMIHYPGSLKGMEFARRLLAAAVDVLGLPNRGIKEPINGTRGSRWLRGTRMPAVMVESFFIDNDLDLKRGVGRVDALARAYAEVLVHYNP